MNNHVKGYLALLGSLIIVSDVSASTTKPMAKQQMPSYLTAPRIQEDYIEFSYDTDNYVNLEVHNNIKLPSYKFIEDIELYGHLNREMIDTSGFALAGIRANFSLPIENFNIAISPGIHYSRIFLETPTSDDGSEVKKANVYVPSLKLGKDNLFIQYQHMKYVGGGRLLTSTTYNSLGYQISASVPILFNFNSFKDINTALSAKVTYSDYEKKTARTVQSGLEYEYNGYTLEGANIRKFQKNQKDVSTVVFKIGKKFSI